MGLSEREQKLLEELERGLYASDSSLAHKLGKPGSFSPKRLVAGLAISVIGLSLLVVAVMVQFAAFGVIGFLLMLLGLAFASGAGKSAAKLSANEPSSPEASQSNTKKGFFDARWDRRTGQ